MNGTKKKFRLQTVLHVPHLLYIIVSISRGQKKGYRIPIDGSYYDCWVGEMVSSYKQSVDIKRIGTESRNGSHEVAMKRCTESANIAIHKLQALPRSSRLLW